MLRGIETPEQILLLILSLAGALLFAWWTYQGNENLPPLKIAVLTSLRGLAIFLLILLLFNPVIRQTRMLTEKPVIGVLLDNSKSVAIEKGDYKGESSYRNALEPLALSDTTGVSYRVYAFDHQPVTVHHEDLDLTGSSTDINMALAGIIQAEPEIRALIIYTDGIFNRGRDPSFTASQLPIPIITVALGDTASIRDIVVRNININDTGYKNTITPITAEILNDGFPDTEFEVHLRHDGEIMDSKTVSTSASRSTHTVQFNLELTETGLQLYEVYVPEVTGEWTTSNNHSSGTIEVLDDQLRVLHVAFEVHPDVGAVRNLLATDESISLTSLNWYGQETFFGGNLTTRADTLDLLILHGYPNPGIPLSISEAVTQLMDDVPVILFSTPEMDHTALTRELGNRLPVLANRPVPRSSIQLQAVDENTDHPVMDLPVIDLFRSPMLKAPVTGIEKSLGSTTLFSARLRNEQTDVPVISIRTVGNKRISQVNAFELYRWFQEPGGDYSDYITALLNNLVKWTSNIPDNRLLTVSPLRPVFEETEQVRFEATLRNESGNLESDAVVELSIVKGDEQAETYTMTNRGLGRYTLQVPSMPSGIYSYESVAKKGNLKLDEQTGNFNVSETNLEYLETRRNDDLLQLMAANTEGKFITFDEASALPSILRDLELLDATTEAITRDKPLYQSPSWFLLVMLLLTAEWLIRKTSALV
jgi:hypothetical protein